MLKDLTRDDWLTLLDIPKSRVPVALVLRGTRNLRRNYDLYKQYFTSVLEVGTPNGVLEDVLIGDLNGLPVAYASVYGAPMASEVVHVFGVLGTPLVIQTGCCGALGDGIAAGDLFVVTEAYCGEGAAQYYRPSGKLVKASVNLQQALSSRLGDGISAYWGRIYTTSALFAEGIDEVETWYRQGFGAVDMETATTFAVAEHFGMDRTAILFAFDNPRDRQHLLLEDEEKDKRRAIGNKRMIEVALELASSSAGHVVLRNPD